MDSTMITVSEVKALLKCAAKSGRPNIEGIAVGSGGRLAASNGYILVIRGQRPRAEWPRKPNLVPTQVWLDAIAGLKGSDQIAVDVDDHEVRVGSQRVVCEKVAPPFDALFGHTQKPAPEIGIGGHYVAVLGEIDKATKDKKGMWIMHCSGELDPVLFAAGGRGPAVEDWLVLVMPMRR